jgi:hypothetical protein
MKMRFSGRTREEANRKANEWLSKYASELRGFQRGEIATGDASSLLEATLWTVIIFDGMTPNFAFSGS